MTEKPKKIDDVFMSCWGMVVSRKDFVNPKLGEDVIRDGTTNDLRRLNSIGYDFNKYFGRNEFKCLGEFGTKAQIKTLVELGLRFDKHGHVALEWCGHRMRKHLLAAGADQRKKDRRRRDKYTIRSALENVRNGV
jgi:hypothetical protein